MDEENGTGISAVTKGKAKRPFLAIYKLLEIAIQLSRKEKQKRCLHL